MSTEPATLSPADYADPSAPETPPAAETSVDEAPAMTPEQIDELLSEMERMKARLNTSDRREAHRQELVRIIRDRREAEEQAKESLKAAKESRETAENALFDFDSSDAQQILDDVGEFTSAGPKQTTLADAISSAPQLSPEDELRARINAGDAVTIPELDWSKVAKAAVSTLMSTGKPQKLVGIEISGAKFVLTDVQFNGAERIAVFHQVYSREQWNDHYGETIPPLKVPNEERSATLCAGGPLFGVPVRIGRTNFFIGKLADALLVRIPAEAAIGGEAEAEDTGHDEPEASADA